MLVQFAFKVDFNSAYQAMWGQKNGYKIKGYAPITFRFHTIWTVITTNLSFFKYILRIHPNPRKIRRKLREPSISRIYLEINY